jgi:hypothetical protein
LTNAHLSNSTTKTPLLTPVILNDVKQKGQVSSSLAEIKNKTNDVSVEQKLQVTGSNATHDKNDKIAQKELKRTDAVVNNLNNSSAFTTPNNQTASTTVNTTSETSEANTKPLISPSAQTSPVVDATVDKKKVEPKKEDKNDEKKQDKISPTPEQQQQQQQQEKQPSPSTDVDTNQQNKPFIIDNKSIAQDSVAIPPPKEAPVIISETKPNDPAPPPPPPPSPSPPSPIANDNQLNNDAAKKDTFKINNKIFIEDKPQEQTPSNPEKKPEAEQPAVPEKKQEKEAVSPINEKK